MTRSPLLLISLIFSAWVMTAAADEVDDIYKLADLNKPEMVMERLDAYLSTHPKDARGRFLKGLVHTDLKQRDEAISVFRKLTEDYPELPEPLNNLAVLYAEQGDYDNARNALLMAIKTHPSYATAHENLGDIYAKLASQAYSKALQLNQNSSATQAKLALVKRLFVPPTQGGEEHPTVLAKADPVKAESAQIDMLKMEQAKKAEQAKMDRAKAEQIKAEKAEQAKAEKAEQAKAEQAKAEQAKAELAKAELAKAELAKAELAKAERAKAELAKAERAKAEPAKAEPTTATKQDKDEVVNALLAWANAWSSQNVTKYVGHYSAKFKPSDGLSREKWEKMREQRLRAPRFIKVLVSGISMEMTESGMIKASFKQEYQSNTLNSTGNKTLLMIREAGSWRILQETYDG